MMPRSVLCLLDEETSVIDEPLLISTHKCETLLTVMISCQSAFLRVFGWRSKKKEQKKKETAVKKDRDRQKTRLCTLKTKPNSYIRKDCGREPPSALQQLFGSIRALLDSSPPMQLYFARLNSSGGTAPSFCTIVSLPRGCGCALESACVRACVRSVRYSGV